MTYIPPAVVDVDVNTRKIAAGGFDTAIFVRDGGVSKILVPSPGVSERPSIACVSEPRTGIAPSVTNVSIVIQNTTGWTFQKGGDGFWGLMHNSGNLRKDGDTYQFGNIFDEVNKDCIAWVDNRLPDGVLGHDVGGRFIVFRIGTATSFRVGNSTVIATVNFGVGASAPFGGGTGVVGIQNASVVPASNPSGGGVLYVEGGALKYRGSSGTVTTLGPA